MGVVSGPRDSIFFYKSVIKLVLIFDAESCLVTPHMGRDLRGFQDQLARLLTGSLPWNIMNGRWENTLAEAANVEAGFDTTEN